MYSLHVSKMLIPLNLDQTAPCFEELTAIRVFDEFVRLIEKSVFPEIISVVNQKKESSE